MSGCRDLELVEHEDVGVDVMQFVEQQAVHVHLEQLELPEQRHGEVLTQLQVLLDLLVHQGVRVGRRHLVGRVGDLVGRIRLVLDRVDDLGGSRGHVDTEFGQAVDAVEKRQRFIAEVHDDEPWHFRSGIGVHPPFFFWKVFRHVIVPFYEG